MSPRQRQLIIIYMVMGALITSLVWADVSHTSASTNQTTLQTVNIADQKFKDAFAMVREAEAAGAESAQMRELVNRLNFALNLTDETEAAIIFDQVKAEADQLRDAAAQASFYKKTFIFLVVPVAALIVTFSVHYGLKFLRQNKVEQAMKTKIKEKKET